MTKKSLRRSRSHSLSLLTFLAVTAASATVFARQETSEPRPPVSATAAAPPPLPAKAAEPKIVRPARPQATPGPSAQVTYLVRTTLMALDDANRTGNYTVLRDRAGEAFRQKNSAADLATTFAPFRSARLDLSAITLLDPILLAPPQRPNEKTLVLTGQFATAPKPIVFSLGYVAEAGQWRLDQLSVGLGPPKP
jgi:hypothetical protein